VRTGNKSSVASNAVALGMHLSVDDRICAHGRVKYDCRDCGGNGYTRVDLKQKVSVNTGDDDRLAKTAVELDSVMRIECKRVAVLHANERGLILYV
jgi:hypothetical protein